MLRLSREGPHHGGGVLLKTVHLVALLCCSAAAQPSLPQQRFICTPIPLDTDPGCFPTGVGPLGGSGSGVPGSGSSGGQPGGGLGGSSSSNGMGGNGVGGDGGSSGSSWWGLPEEAKATILHLRESLVQQKETILDQRDKIRELTAKLTLCEGFGRGMGAHSRPMGPEPHLTHHTLPPHHSGHIYPDSGHHGDPEALYPAMGLRGHHKTAALGDKHPGEMAPPTSTSSSSSPDQLERMLHMLKERLDSLQTHNTSMSYSTSLKDLLQRKIQDLEQQLGQTTSHHGRSNNSHYDDDDDEDEDDDEEEDDGREDDEDDQTDDDVSDDLGHFDAHRSDGSHDDRRISEDEDEEEEDSEDEEDNEMDSFVRPRSSHHTQSHRSPGGVQNRKLDAVLNHLQNRLTDTGSRKKAKIPEGFQIGFPMRTNYMYGRVKPTLSHEIFALTLCLWLRGGAGPGLGTPFSYSVPGQANELVLIEWGNNPMELLVNDKAVTLPLSLSDGKWHHVCVTWSTRDGQWEAYQDGVKRGSGENLSSWHPIKPGGVFVLGQEQDTLGGRFDATQAFVGEISDLQMWSRVLSSRDIYSLGSCNGHMTGDVIAWSESALELHGGVTNYPFDPCH